MIINLTIKFIDYNDLSKTRNGGLSVLPWIGT